MKKLMLIAIVGMFAVTAFAQGPHPSRNPGRGPSPRVERREPPRHGGMSDDLARAVGITHIVRDSIGILSDLFGPPPPPPRVITPAPVVIPSQPIVVRQVVPQTKTVIITPESITTPTTVIQTTPTTTTTQVVEKTVDIKNIEPVVVSDKIYYKVTYTDGTIKFFESK